MPAQASGGGRINVERPGVYVLAILVSLLATPAAFATLTDGLQNDANSGGDAGDSPDHATIVTAGPFGGQTFMIDDPADWYAFTLDGAPQEPLVEVHLDFTITSPTCSGLNIPISLQTVTIRLFDPTGAMKSHFTTTGCNATGRFDVEERAGNGTSDQNPGIGTWTIGVTIDGLGGMALPADPTGITAGHMVVAGERAPLVNAQPPRGNASPPNAEEDYTLILGCRPHC